MTTAANPDSRSTLLETFRSMEAADLNRGTSGNASVRVSTAPDHPDFLITPSGVPIAQLSGDDLVVISGGRFVGSLEPSSEWRLHTTYTQRFPMPAPCCTRIRRSRPPRRASVWRFRPSII